MKPLLPLAACAALLLPLLSCSGGGGSGASGKWNVIVITLDTTRADYLSTYGREGDATPAMDSLAADGVRFDMAVSTASVTPVSHASILTGLNQYRHRLRVLSGEGGYTLPKDVPHLAGVLKGRGYKTGAIHSAFPVSAHFGFDRDFDHFDSFDAAAMNTSGASHSWDVSQHQRRSDDTSKRAIQYLENTDEPFFLWLHYWDPHDANMKPPARFLKQHMPNQATYTGSREERMEQLTRDFYAAEVSYLDSQLGVLFQHLKDKGLYENTMIVLTADHGEGLGEHDWGAHRILYQEQIHVPLIVYVPGGPSGKAVTQLVSTIDVYPTVLDYLDVSAPGEIDGRSLRALMETGNDEPRVAYADQINSYDMNARMVQRRPKADFLYMVMDDEYKLIYRPTRPQESELYRYREDPDEAVNLWDSEPEHRLRLLDELGSRNSWVTFPPQPEGDLTPEEIARREQAQAALGGLGYTAGEAPDAPSEDQWGWMCPAHMERLLERRDQRCPDCERLPILRKK